MAEANLKDLTGAVVRIAEHTPIIKSDVKDIRDAVCGPAGILEAFNVLNKKMENMEKKESLRFFSEKNKKRNADINNRNLIKNTHSITEVLNKIFGKVEKLSNVKNRESSNRRFLRQEDMVRNADRLRSDNFRRNRRPDDQKMKGLDSISRSVDIMERLKNFRLRDFLFAKRKLKTLNDITLQSKKTYNIFKNKEEADETLSFVNSSVDVIKKLGKVWLISKPAKLGVKAIERIYLGDKKSKGGLIGLFRSISKNTVHIEKGRASIASIAKSCGSMLLTTIALAGIAVTGIPAMAGALLMRGIIHILIGAYKVLAKPQVLQAIIKGSVVLLMMSASILSFGLGLGLLGKSVRNIKVKDVGIMVLSLTGIGLSVAGIGLLAAPIALGSASLMLMGASLGIFAMSIMAWEKIDSKKAMGNVKEAIGGLREALGIELGKHDGKKNMFQRIGGGIVDIAMSFINMGSTFFMMGTLLFAGFALGVLYHGLKRWDNFDGKKAATNIKAGVGALKDALGIGGMNGETRGGFRKVGSSLLDLGLSLFQGGKALVDMGVITIATAMADLIRVTLIPWQRYNAKPAASNLKIAIDALKDVFGLDKKNETKSKFGRLVGSFLDMGVSLFKGGGELAQVGTISIATAMSDIIRLALKPWDNYNPSAAVGNMGLAINSLTKLFGLDENNRGLFGKIGKLAGSLVDMGTTLLNGGGVLAKMGTITLATGMLSKIKDNLITWEDYNASKPITNIRTAIDGLLNTFGLSAIERDAVETANAMKKSKGFWETVGEGLKAPFKIASSAAEAAQGAMENGRAMSKISKVLNATSAMFSIKGSLEPWEEYNSGPAISNIGNAISGINGLFHNIINIRNLEPNNVQTNAAYFESSTSRIGKGIRSLANSWKKSEVLKSMEVPFKKTVDVVNSIDMSKAKVMIELFGSFSKISKRPFDKFTNAVNKFAESSTDLIDALNNFSNNYTMSESNNVGSNSNEPTLVRTEGININNPEALAAALAEAIKSIPINVETNVSDIRLVVDNQAGRRIVFTLDD